MTKKVTDRLAKQAYMKPEVTVYENNLEGQLLIGSVTTTGLGEDNIIYDTTSGDSWTDGMSRRNFWDDGEEW